MSKAVPSKARRSKVRCFLVAATGSSSALMERVKLDVRGTLRTDDGHLIYSYYHGILHTSPEVFQRVARGETVDPSEYYFQTAPFYETGSEKYGWLNRVVAVAVGRMAPLWVGYSVYAIL